MADAIVASEERGKWSLEGLDDFGGDLRAETPSGIVYEISAERLQKISAADRGFVDLLRDALTGLESLQVENDALRALDAIRDRAEGQSAFELQAKVEAVQSAKAADKAGFEAVVWDLTKEFHLLKSLADVDRLMLLADRYAGAAEVDGIVGRHGSPDSLAGRKSLVEYLERWSSMAREWASKAQEVGK